MKSIYINNIVITSIVVLGLALFAVSASAQTAATFSSDTTNASVVEGTTDAADYPVACTADAKICPDGSAVGRVGPNCEFAACPGEESSDAGYVKYDDIKGESDDRTSDVTEDPTDPEPANAAGYIKIGDIKGESEDKDSVNPDGTIVNPDDEKAASGFMKIGDIKGESDTSAAKKPKEIVVVGSKVREAVEAGVEVRGWDPVKKEAIIGAADVETEEDLEDYLSVLLLSSNDRIDTISVGQTDVNLRFDQPVKVLGLIDIDMPQDVTVSGDEENLGRVKVKFPWWSFFASKKMTKAELIEAMAAGVDVEKFEHREEFGQTQKQQQTLQTMSNISKMLHDTAMAVIRKIG